MSPLKLLQDDAERYFAAEAAPDSGPVFRLADRRIHL